MGTLPFFAPNKVSKVIMCVYNIYMYNSYCLIDAVINLVVKNLNPI